MSRRGALIGMHPYVAKMPALPYEAPRPGGPRSIRVTSCPDSCSPECGRDTHHSRADHHYALAPRVRTHRSASSSELEMPVTAPAWAPASAPDGTRSPSICQVLCEASPASASLGVSSLRASSWGAFLGARASSPRGGPEAHHGPAGKTPALPAVRTTGLGGPRRGRSGPSGRGSGPFHAARETRPARVRTLAPPRLHLYWQGGRNGARRRGGRPRGTAGPARRIEGRAGGNLEGRSTPDD